MAAGDVYASAIIAEGKRRGITERGIVIGLATPLVETNMRMYANSKVPESLTLPHDAVGSDGFSVGLFQQQIVKSANGYWWADCATCMDATKSAGLFYDRLVKLSYNDTSKSPGSFAQAVQQSAFPDRYDQRMSEAQALYDRLANSAGGGDVVADNRPDFNEYPIWSPNCSSRTPGATPTMFLIHTQEGDGNADSLAKYLANPANQVSYHYTVSKGATDNGVTVVDCVDTDMAAWAVLDANVKSINLCFAGSYAAWTRAQWLTQERAIDVAAYLIVQDCIKYGIKPVVVPPPYTAGTPGISDHKYVTDVLKVGTHVDVGPGFPWDVLAAAVAKYMGTATVPTTPATPTFTFPSNDVMIREIWQQLRGPEGKGWDQLGGKSLVDAVAGLVKA